MVCDCEIAEGDRGEEGPVSSSAVRVVNCGDGVLGSSVILYPSDVHPIEEHIIRRLGSSEPIFWDRLSGVGAFVFLNQFLSVASIVLEYIPSLRVRRRG